LVDLPETSSAIKEQYVQLSDLLKRIMPKAQKGDESAVNAVVKIMQVQQQMLLKFGKPAPKEPTSLERFRQESETRHRKNTSKYK